MINILPKKLKLLYNSLLAFKEDNLANSFQTMYKIQPSKKINKGSEVFYFKKELQPLPNKFQFKGEKLSTDKFIEETNTTGLIVINDDKIKYEKYFLGANENTLLSSNSVCKSFVSSLLGIAISEGYISSVNDPIGKYVPELKDTELEKISIKDCLQMSSGIDFDEDTDMSKMSISMLLGKPAIKYISKLKISIKPGKVRKYSSINTEIIGEVITNATGYSLSEYLEEKIWKRIGVEKDAYWTLSNNKELAMGGLSISLRDYARFARLYINNGKWNNEQIIPSNWIKDSIDTSEHHLRPGSNNDSYSAFGYGYKWWVPEGKEGEFMAIGIYSQWIYINPNRNVIIVKTSAHPRFMDTDHELKTVELFRSIVDSVSSI
ncbi:serine hydrolase domain-containing protein [Paraclostridium sordellii]|uniref:serine hydrolase domain-containing protein n=1 Tax=Paraclostridium sordellii TaxID=1505 RepID=UPI0005DEB670|nr:serine hydrolase [Paeniclostridium sordellii]CEN81243.1 beta-lactamase [[Clostridium] sordellii] [Paeniclostridium sordellii]